MEKKTAEFHSTLPYPSTRSAILLALATIAISLIWWLPKFTASGNPFDEAILLVYPELCLLGKILHRDFQAYYGPANIWLLAGVYNLFGISIGVERIVGLVERTVLLFLMGCLALRLQPRAIVATLLSTLLILTPLSLIALAWIPTVIFALAGLLVSIRVRNHSHYAAIAGFLLATSLQFRPDAGPAVLLASGVYLISWNSKQRWQWLAGFLIGNLPMLLHLLTAGPQALWNNLIFYPLFVVKDGRIIHWAEVKAIIKPLLALGFFLATANLVTGWIFWRRRPDTDGTPLYFAAAVLGAGLSHQIFQRCDLAHLAMGSLITFPLGAITLHHWLPWKKGWLQTLVGTIACVVLFTICAPSYANRIAFPQLREVVSQKTTPAAVLTNNNRTWPLDPPTAQFHANLILQYLHEQGRDGDKIFVGPGDLRRTFYSDLYFYHLLLPKIQPSGYFLELNPLLTNSETSGIDQQIARSQWVLLNQIYDHFFEANRSSEYGSSKPNNVLKSRFHETLRSGPFILYRISTSPPLENPITL